MKKIAIVIMVIFSSFDLFAKSTTGNDVDPLIEARFRQQFGLSVKASWEVIDDISIATFKEKGEEKSVFYDTEGRIIGFGKIIPKGSLPELAQQAITTRFHSEYINVVYEYKSNDSPIRYIVVLASRKYSRIISSTEFGEIQFIREIKNQIAK